MSAFRFAPVVVLALAGCGSTTDDGGGPGGSYVSASCPGTTQQDGLECEALSATNRARAQGATCISGPYPAVGPLAMNAKLRTAARLYAEELAQKDRWSHEGADGSMVTDRVLRQGYQYRVVGENIAGGSPTAEGSVQQWLDSPDGHCELLMSGDYVDVGLGYAYSEAATYQHYWVMVLGTAL